MKARSESSMNMMMDKDHSVRPRQRGFTLIELLVVISVIIILLTIGAGVTSKLLGEARKERAEGVVLRVDNIITALIDNRAGRPIDHTKKGMDIKVIYEEALLYEDTKILLDGVESELRDEGSKSIIDPWGEELVWASFVNHSDKYKNDDFLPTRPDPFVASSGKDKKFGDAKDKPGGKELRDNVYSFEIR
jgi:prepilin-type N-terminal cleavage/methylation domain-containing protein